MDPKPENKPKQLFCQMTMSDSGKSPTGEEHYWRCGKPAKFWIKDEYNRKGWDGRQHLCGLHARAYNRNASKGGRPPATPL